jgi:uncharacterized protein (TIGR02284 family)
MKEMKKSEVVDILNNLIAKCYDAEEGYISVGESTENPSLKTLLYARSQQRYEFGHELKTEIERLGGEVNKGTTALADVHRAWISLKTAVSSNDEVAALEEVKRGEEYALEEYDAAIEKLSGFEQSFKVVSSQRAKIATSLADTNVRLSMYEKV